MVGTACHRALVASMTIDLLTAALAAHGGQRFRWDRSSRGPVKQPGAGHDRNYLAIETCIIMQAHWASVL